MECRASFEILNFAMKASLTKSEVFIFYLISWILSTSQSLHVISHCNPVVITTTEAPESTVIVSMRDPRYKFKTIT